MKKTTYPHGSKMYLVIVAGIVVLLVLVFAIQKIFFKTSPFDPSLKQAAAQLNTPYHNVIDSETRLDKTMTFPGNIIRYNYTLVNYRKEDLNIELLKKNLQPNIIEQVKTNPELKIFRNRRTQMEYFYYDKNGIYLFNIVVKPTMY